MVLREIATEMLIIDRPFFPEPAKEKEWTEERL
jgi:hypothetical protein